MVSLRTAACLMLAASLSMVVASSAFPDDSPASLVARPAGATTDPVAVIDPLPDTVSNGTGYYLDGFESYDYDDELVNITKSLANYTWEVTHGDSTEVMYGSWVFYRFHELGLYEIRLTVADQWGNTGVNFTAVISVDDSDDDGLPDWWELAYMDSMSPGADGDFDSDGYTNLYEWYAGTLPNVPDPPPSTDFLEKYWVYIVLAAAAIVAVSSVLYVGASKRRREREAKKIAIAVELEKTLDEE
ncbi:MAG: hypothetical protein AB7S97_05825 [Thermoplasmata archaeon]